MFDNGRARQGKLRRSAGKRRYRLGDYETALSRLEHGFESRYRYSKTQLRRTPTRERDGPFVYRLGRHPFTVQRGVRFPYGLRGGTQGRGNRKVCGWYEGGASAQRERLLMSLLRSVASRSRSSVWLEHSTVTREVAGSSPVGPVWKCPGGEIGRHAILRGWCRKASRFESAPGHPRLIATVAQG